MPHSDRQRELTEVLTSFGLNKKDQDVYLGLLTLGSSTITPLSRALRMPATTVQSAANRLHADGLVGISKRKSRQVYEALDPIVLKRLLEEKIKEVSGIVPLLQALQKDEHEDARLRVYYRERMTDVFNEALSAKSKYIYEIIAARELQEIIGEKFHFTRRRVAANVRLKSLRVESQEIKKYSRQTHDRELREAKFLPRELTFRANLLFWDNTVAFFSTKSEGIAWIVKSAVIKESVQQIFDLLWSISRRMETDTSSIHA
ncbi:MAG: helix-turn-helix domain-containing protein [Patescibacteria group bacterium]